MPIVQPLPEQDDAGEGQLRPIAVDKPQQQQQQPAPQPQPQAQPQAQPARPPQAQPAAPRPAPGHRTVTLSVPSLSLKGTRRAATATAGEGTPTAPMREGTYTDDDVMRLWDSWIIDHPQEVILVNTMRASRPVRTGGDTFNVTVENAAQQQKINDFMPQLLAMLRDGTGNDRIALTTAVNRGAGGSHTWSEREVLAHMLDHIPALRGFIDTFKLNIG